MSQLYFNRSSFFKYLIFLIFLPFEIIHLVLDLIKYKFFKINNSEKSFQTFLKLFLISGGFTNNLVHKFLSKKKKSFICNDKKNKENLINNEKNYVFFDSEGYFLKENFISDNDLDKIRQFLNHQLGYYRSENLAGSERKLTKLDSKNPAAVAFHYQSSNLLESIEIQNLLINYEILEFVQTYLGSLPIIDLVECWWSFPTSKPDKEVAQMWHFDMDRPKWVKVFFFLEDCNVNNGPHCFIKGSHKDNILPFNIRKKGYSRIEDRTIEKLFKRENEKIFTANKKTILFEDTRGLHKGQRVESGKRLMLQFQYSSSLFGANTKKISFPGNSSNKFLNFKNNNKEIFSNFVEKNYSDS